MEVPRRNTFLDKSSKALAISLLLIRRKTITLEKKRQTIPYLELGCLSTGLGFGSYFQRKHKKKV